MGKRLAELEADRLEEYGAAGEWLAEHEAELPPIPDRDAERPQERVTLPDGTRLDRIVSLVVYTTDDNEVEQSYAESDKFLPILSEPRHLDVSQANINARVKHVLTFIPDVQVKLLLDYCAHNIPWQELRNGEESKQAVYKRISRAKRAFLKAWIAHAEDEVVITERDF